MVRLRFTRSTSASLSPVGRPQQNLREGDAEGATPLIATRTASPFGTISTPARNNRLEPNSNDENAINGGNVNVLTTVTARSIGGDARENRPTPSSQDSKATKRAAKKVLKLLDSPRKVIMSRAKFATSSSLSSGGRGTRSGAGVSGGGTSSNNSSDRRSHRPERMLQGRSASVPSGLGSGFGAASPSPTVVPNANQESLLHGNAAGVGYSQVSSTPNSNYDVNCPQSAGKLQCGQFELFGGKSTGFPVQQDILFDPLNHAMVMALGTGATCSSTTTRLKDDGAANVLQWLHDVAPQDILPRVLSFAGSRKIDALSRTCKSWRSLTLSDAVWRTACEDTAKWKEGQPLPEGTWLEHYCDNPLVPIDYDALEDAFNVNSYDGTESGYRDDGGRSGLDANNARPTVPEHRRSVRVLLRPGKYIVRESLVVHAIGDKLVTIETVEVPHRVNNHNNACSVASYGQCLEQNLWLEDALMAEYDNSHRVEQLGLQGGGRGEQMVSSSSGRRLALTPSGLSRRASSLRNLLSCRSSAGSDVVDNSTNGGVDQDSTSSMPNLQGYGPDGDAPLTGRGGSSGRYSYSSGRFDRPPPKRAVIVLKTRKHNEPIVRVRQGTVRLHNIDLIHNASGTDIWNGNAAVQVQPPFDEQDNPLTVVPPSMQPTAILDKVNIMSVSGRGVVNIDGGFASINDCYIHNCAATGIYVGGPGSVANVARTDVVHNGNGNERSRRGIARGHSGVYLEQGVATLRDCNVSNNSLTGISAVSSDNAALTVEETDLMSNGSIQLEMPPLGSASHRRSVSRNNSVSAGGRGRSRSGLLTVRTAEGPVGNATPPRPRRRNESDDRVNRDRPQSPDDADAQGEVSLRSPQATAHTTAPAATVSAQRRMRFAALDEGHLAPAVAPIVPMVD